MGFDRFQIIFHRIVNADIKYFEAGTLEHHAHEILSDVMDIPFHGADHNTAHRFRPGFGQQGPQDSHAAFHSVGRHQHLRHEKDTVPKINADDPHPFHKCVGEHLISRPAPPQQDIGSFFDLFFQPIIEVIVHLLDKFLIGEAAQIQIIRFFFGHNRITLTKITPAKPGDILWVKSQQGVLVATQHHRITTLRPARDVPEEDKPRWGTLETAIRNPELGVTLWNGQTPGNP